MSSSFLGYMSDPLGVYAAIALAFAAGVVIGAMWQRAR